MKVLLTGASGFVGSHILDSLCKHGLPAAVLLRPTSDTRLISPLPAGVEVRHGSLSNPDSLRQAMDGVTHVIHCAGCTRARRNSEFYEVNQGGTRSVVEAASATTATVRRLIHISSLAAHGPALPAQPASEEARPHPVSEYGRSKLAGEQEVRNRCRVEHVILRPPAVYGPRDGEFLRLFKAVKGHVRPIPRSQPLSLAFVPDLAEAVVACLEPPAAAGRTYFVASPEVVTAREMADEIATQMGLWTVPVPLPTALLWPVCLAQEIKTRLTGRANVLSLQKFAELRAPGWVCSASRLKNEIGYECKTGLKEGIARTLSWYRQNGWL